MNLSDPLRKGVQAASQLLLFDSSTAHALLNLAESAQNEENRFRAILKAEEVIGSMNGTIAQLSATDETRRLIENARNELQMRLERAVEKARHPA